MWDPGLRRLVKAHFGNPLRIQLAGWVLADGAPETFKQSEAQDGVRHVSRSVSSVPDLLMSFVDYGMLHRSDTESGNVYYTVLEHPLWDAYRAIIRSIETIAEDGSTAGARHPAAAP